MKTMHLFAGAGGGILADLILGHEPIIAVEWEPYACQVLRERAEDGWFPGLQVWEGDVRLFDPSEYKGKVDCIHAGFPCQDISVAGSQAGVGEGSRSGLYREVLRIADEVQPGFIFLENVAAIVTGDGGNMLRTVAGDLASRGFDAVWTNLSAAEVGAPHKRDRWWLLGYPKHTGQPTTKIKSGPTSGNDSSEAWSEQTSEPSRSSQQHENVADTTSNNRHKRSELGGDGRADKTEQAGLGCTRDDVSDSTSQGLSDRRRSKWQKGPKEAQAGMESESERCGENVSDTDYRSGNTRAEQSGREKRADTSGCGERSEVANANCAPAQGNKCAERGQQESAEYSQYGWWEAESEVGRVVDGMAYRAHQLKALGNGQVPLQAAAAFSILWQMMEAANKG